MAIADIKQRPGVVLCGAIILHVVLISAQVNTASGLPVLQVVTFGSFSEVQRGMMAVINGVRGMWSGYIALQQVEEENNALRHELQTLQITLQQERAEAQRTDNLRQLLELRERAQLDTGSPVSSRRRLSRLRSSEPPPVMTMPRSTMSADSSGGVRSSATRTASTITLTVSASASRISSSVMVMVFGTPSIRCRPLISIVMRSSSG